MQHFVTCAEQREQNPNGGWSTALPQEPHATCRTTVFCKQLVSLDSVLFRWLKRTNLSESLQRLDSAVLVDLGRRNVQAQSAQQVCNR